jgi:hypothetical protein
MSAYRALKARAKAFPLVPAAYSMITAMAHKLRPVQRDDVFSTIYEENSWNDPESRSGAGSNLLQTVVVRRELPRLLAELSAHSLLDAPCGDFYWLSELDLGGVRYTGVDIVPQLIERNSVLYGREDRRFVVGDVVSDPLPAADVILCRDCLVHLPYDDVHAALANFVASGSRYLLTTTFTDRKRNYDKQAGGWRPLNLTAAPFNLPAPITLINEECTVENGSFADKSLGLWSLQGLATSK